MSNLASRVTALSTAAMILFSPIKSLAEDVKKPFEVMLNYRFGDRNLFQYYQTDYLRFSDLNDYNTLSYVEADRSKMEKLELNLGDFKIKIQGSIGISLVFIKRF